MSVSAISRVEDKYLGADVTVAPGGWCCCTCTCCWCHIGNMTHQEDEDEL